MRKMLYANDGVREYVVTDVDLEKSRFKGFYKEINGSKHYIEDRICDYMFYDNYTEWDETVNLRDWLKEAQYA